MKCGIGESRISVVISFSLSMHFAIYIFLIHYIFWELFNERLPPWKLFTIMDFFFLMSQSLSNPAPNILWLRSITFTALKRQKNSHGSSLRYKLVIYKHTTPLSFLCDCDVGLWYCVKCRADVLWLLCCCGYCNITLKPKIPRKRHDTLHMLLYYVNVTCNLCDSVYGNVAFWNMVLL